jgi:hypothetical protein
VQNNKCKADSVFVIYRYFFFKYCRRIQIFSFGKEMNAEGGVNAQNYRSVVFMVI